MNKSTETTKPAISPAAQKAVEKYIGDALLTFKKHSRRLNEYRAEFEQMDRRVEETLRHGARRTDGRIIR